MKELAGIVKLGGAKLTTERLANDLPAMKTYVDVCNKLTNMAGGL